MEKNGFPDLFPHGHDRVQACHGILADQRKFRAADGTVLPLRQFCEIPAVQKNLPGNQPAGMRDQAHDAPRQHGLAAAGFPDNAGDFSRADRKGDVTDSFQFPLLRKEAGAKIADLKGILTHLLRPLYRLLRCGSSTSRSPSPRKLNAKTVSMTATQGAKPSHGAV